MPTPESRPHERTSTTRRFGRSWCYITCPFCGTTVQAFIWSLAGGGKRCPECRALHTGWGRSLAPQPKGEKP